VDRALDPDSAGAPEGKGEEEIAGVEVGVKEDDAEEEDSPKI